MTRDLQVARTFALRGKILSLLDRAGCEGLNNLVLLPGVASIQATDRDLQRELDYLQQRKLVVASGPSSGDHRLTALGQDCLEGSVSIPGILIADDVLIGHYECTRRQAIRWRLLAMLDSSRPIPLRQGLAQRVLQDVSLTATPGDLRKTAEYLQDKALLKIEEVGRDYQMMLTADGVDVATYQTGCPIGVGRPEKYWD